MGCRHSNPIPPMDMQMHSFTSNYCPPSDTAISALIQNVTDNICELVAQFAWMRRVNDTTPPDFDRILAQLIYDFALKQEVVISLLPIQLSSNGPTYRRYSIGAQCRGQAIVSGFSLPDKYLKNVNGVTNGLKVWINSEPRLRHYERFYELKKFNKYSSYIIFEGDDTITVPQIKLLDPSIDDAVFLFLEPREREHESSARKVQADGWTKLGTITQGYSLPFNVWEYPLRNLTEIRYCKRNWTRFRR